MNVFTVEHAVATKNGRVQVGKCLVICGGTHSRKNRKPEKVSSTLKSIIQSVSEDICDNYCKFRDTADEDFLCDAIRNGGKCPLDRLQ